MMTEIRLFWWTWVIIGFSAGAYIHCALLRHIINWTLIKVLRGVIWLLQKTDRYQREPTLHKPTKTKSPIKIKDGTIETDEAELRKWLDKNPEISVSKR